MYGLAQTTAPTAEPLTLVEVKQHLRRPEEVGADDSLLLSQLAAARQDVEDRTNRQLMSASWTLKLDCFPLSGKLYLPRAPLASVTTFHYLESAAGASTLWASSNYRVGTSQEPGEITLAYGVAFPSVYPVSNAITIVYVAGYSTAALVPPKAKQAIKLKLSEWNATTTMEAESCRKAYESLIQSLSYGDDFVAYAPVEAYA